MKPMRMLRSINFKDQAMTKFRKVENVSIKWNLSAKMKTSLVECLECQPQFHLFMRHGFAQCAGAGSKVWPGMYILHVGTL
jgi:hypothetical protein